MRDLDMSDVIADAERMRAIDANAARAAAWMRTQPLDDEVARAASELIVAIGRFVEVAQPFMRASEHRTLEAALDIARTLPGEER